jgi:hypothetical protein
MVLKRNIVKRMRKVNDVIEKKVFLPVLFFMQESLIIYLPI